MVIFGAGAGMPYFSTDTVSIQRSLEIHCDEVLMGKNGVDGVYTSDPRKDADAKRFATLSYNRALSTTWRSWMPPRVMARDNRKRIRVFGLEEAGERDPRAARRGDRHAGVHRRIHARVSDAHR